MAQINSDTIYTITNNNENVYLGTYLDEIYTNRFGYTPQNGGYLEVQVDRLLDAINNINLNNLDLPNQFEDIFGSIKEVEKEIEDLKQSLQTIDDSATVKFITNR